MFTTYGMIDDGTGDNSGLLAQLEGLTGNRVAYGQNTPIYFPDIVSGCGPQTAISCLPYAVQEYIPTAQVIGVEMVKLYNDIWRAIFPDDSRPFDLLYYLELIISGQNTVIPNRVDYCGNDLGGATLITNNQLQDILDNLQAKMDALDYTGHFTRFTFYIANDTGPINAETLASWRSVGGNPSSVTITDDDVANPVVDRSQSLITGVHGLYVERSIASAIEIDQYVNDTFDYDEGQSPYYYRVTFQRPYSTEAGLYDYANTAAQWFFLALKTATKQVMNETGVNLSSVYTYLRNARVDYNNFQQQTIRPLLTSVNQMSNGLVPVESTGNAALDAAGQFVRDAGLNRRAQLLRDPVYVDQFDTNLTGSISAVERVAMENDVKTEMQTARRDAAQSFMAGFQAQFDTYSANVDDLGAIIILYTG